MKGQKLYQQAMHLNKELYQQQGRVNSPEVQALYKAFFNLLRKAAYLGYKEAQFEFGQQFESCNFLSAQNPGNNPKRSFFWYTKACDAGHADACNHLAFQYEKGLGCEPDVARALALYKRSGELGSVLGKQNYKLMQKQLATGDLNNRP